MAKLSRDDVLRLAQLSRLHLSNEELDQFSSELTAILDYVEQLSGVDTAGMEPTAQVTGLTNVMRTDEVFDYGATPDELLVNVPARKERYIKVKRVLE